MKHKIKNYTPLTALLGLALATGTANAATTIYESFSYDAGAIYDGTSGTQQTGGSGMENTTGWTTEGLTNNPYTVNSSGLSFTGLSTAGRSVARSGLPNGAEMHRGISSASQTSLTADNTTIWFSVLMGAGGNDSGNINATIALGSTAFTSGSDGGSAPTMAAGDGFGVGFSGFDEIRGFSSTAGVSASSTGALTTVIGGVYLIAGKIDWTTGIDHTLTLYNIDDASDATLTSFATMTASFDQTQLDTLAIFDRQSITIDEIRFGNTLADVGITAVPEPSSTALLGLGGLALILRRRR